MQEQTMKTIELIGGVGAGKSRILEFLSQEYGAEIIQADLVARDLEQKGAE
jgi:dephospho-CoA kinase